MAIELWVSGNFSQEHLGYLQRSLMEKAKHNTDIGMKIKLLGRERMLGGLLSWAFNFVACFIEKKKTKPREVLNFSGNWFLRRIKSFKRILTSIECIFSNTNPTAFPSHHKVMQLQERLLRGVPLTQELSLSVQSHWLLW